VSSAGVPRFAVLYGASTTNDFVVASLLREHTPAVLVSEEQTALDALRRVLRRRGDTLAGRIDKLAFFAWYAAFLAGGVERGLHERLGAHAPLAPQLRVHAIDDALDRVREAAPTFVLAMGTSILGSRWQSLGVPIVNVHIGIAPRYRAAFAGSGQCSRATRTRSASPCTWSHRAWTPVRWCCSAPWSRARSAGDRSPSCSRR
jgi:hypothetical protein